MNLPAFDFQPVIVIGAARSGTNMLRDLLTRHSQVSTWPCDEINYLWRVGNASFPTDELESEQASPRTVATIRKQFARLARQRKAQWVIEKTCANSLRVDYVNAWCATESMWSLRQPSAGGLRSSYRMSSRRQLISPFRTSPIMPLAT